MMQLHAQPDCQNLWHSQVATLANSRPHVALLLMHAETASNSAV